MANRKGARGGGSRKRRPAAVRATGGGDVDAASSQVPPTGVKGEGKVEGKGKSSHEERREGKGKREGPRGPGGHGGGAHRDRTSAGERPRAPWHPLPLSELLILVGAIGALFGLKRGVNSGGPPLLAGIAAVLIGTVEVTLREHLSGYRSHALILTLLPVIVFHSAVVLIVGTLTRVPQALNVGLLLIDAALGTLLFKLLRARYVDARRERTFVGRR